MLRHVPFLLALVAACSGSHAPVTPQGPETDADADSSTDPVALDAGSAADARTPDASPPADATTPAQAVHFGLLSYNVAGLPQGLSGSNPQTNMPLISPMLEPFELVMVQEDFAYHTALVSAVTHAHQTAPIPLTERGDGLTILSRFPLRDFVRVSWTACNGTLDQANDCLTNKGFTYATLDLGEERLVDLYNVHFDAGRSSGDHAARELQVTQLAAFVGARSAGRALILAGDTNMRATDEDTFSRLLQTTGTACACRTLECPEAERIDRILLRSSADLQLIASNYTLESFVDAQGEPLSDHEPVRIDLTAQPIASP